MTVENRLKDLGVNIPEMGAPVASYVPYVIVGDVVYISGQLPREGGEVKFRGHLGKEFKVEDGQKAAKICAINLISALKHACGGNLEKVKKVIQLQVLVGSTPEFSEQHLVANGASDFFAQVFGPEVGAHTRAAYGVASIPAGASVEIMGTFQIG
jgi:enamine deaminase RidA (YjgF/YER057c/UK114 family)